MGILSQPGTPRRSQVCAETGNPGIELKQVLPVSISTLPVGISALPVVTSNGRYNVATFPVSCRLVSTVPPFGLLPHYLLLPVADCLPV